MTHRCSEPKNDSSWMMKFLHLLLRIQKECDDALFFFKRDTFNEKVLKLMTFSKRCLEVGMDLGHTNKVLAEK